MKTKQITIISVLVVIAGLAILAYPIISNMMFQKSQQELIDFYDSQINEIPEKTKDSMMEECRKYNSGLLDSKVQLTDPFDTDALQIEEHPYVDLLNQNGDGAMGSIEIPGINCKLVIYHGTDEAVLAKGVGHLQGTTISWIQEMFFIFMSGEKLSLIRWIIKKLCFRMKQTAFILTEKVIL